MSDLTLVCTVRGAVDAAALMWESFLAHHPRPLFLAYDNGSDDGGAVRAYLAGHADRLIARDPGESISHGAALDVLCEIVSTPYLLAVDSDVEFTGEAVPLMRFLLDDMGDQGVVVYPEEELAGAVAMVFDHELDLQPRVNPCCCLWRTDRLQRLLGAGFGFGTYIGIEQGEWWDVGGMLHMAARAAGWEPLACRSLWKLITHYGEISLLFRPEHELNFHPDLTAQRVAVVAERYETIRRRLAELRELREKENQPAEDS